ncbi:hypothetical protein DFR58_10170 [Anaerobacterium chartisolvens]|uniref:Uncharacterized protein n=1 Tax=Anaerobacterium chartisolvens TaxID=1297424 RepID=A0A369BJU6_9FIRM|nr:hypothetical protein [Anaerobacterium chartisolvens]RCX20868.1 hypothetical protein DFR58_10170 [Anaerobacterium chartisolvens]
MASIKDIEFILLTADVATELDNSSSISKEKILECKTFLEGTNYKGDMLKYAPELILLPVKDYLRNKVKVNAITKQTALDTFSEIANKVHDNLYPVNTTFIVSFFEYSLEEDKTPINEAINMLEKCTADGPINNIYYEIDYNRVLLRMYLSLMTDECMSEIKRLSTELKRLIPLRSQIDAELGAEV